MKSSSSNNNNNFPDTKPNTANQTEALRSILTDWLMRNFQTSSDTSSIVALLLIVFLCWFIINWTIKLLFSLLWPILFISVIYMMIPFIRQDTVDRFLSIVIGTEKEGSAIIQLYNYILNYLRNVHN